MSQLRKNFTYLMSVLIGVMLFLIILAMTLASNTAAAAPTGNTGSAEAADATQQSAPVAYPRTRLSW